MLLQEVPGAKALVGRPFRSALYAKHLRRFRTARRYLRTGVAASGPIPEGKAISIRRRVAWSMAKAKPRSWWRMRQIRHRNSVALARLSPSLPLAAALAHPDLP